MEHLNCPYTAIRQKQHLREDASERTSCHIRKISSPLQADLRLGLFFFKVFYLKYFWNYNLEKWKKWESSLGRTENTTSLKYSLKS